MADINPIKINAGSSKLENNVVNNYTTVSSIKTMQLNGIKNGLNDSEKIETEIYNLPSVEKAFLDLFKGVLFTLNGTPQYSLGLNSPTQIVKYKDLYFITNTFSNRILFSPDMIHWNLIDAPNGENLT